MLPSLKEVQVGGDVDAHTHAPYQGFTAQALISLCFALGLLFFGAVSSRDAPKNDFWSLVSKAW